MGVPTRVNDQVTDQVTQTSVQVLGTSPVVAMSNLMIATSQALAIAAHNATYQQQQVNITARAATVAGIRMLYSINTATTTRGVRRIYK